eukprot:tig00000767_g3956.t1
MSGEAKEPSSSEQRPTMAARGVAAWLEMNFLKQNLAQLEQHFGTIHQLAGREKELCGKIATDFAELVEAKRGALADERSMAMLQQSALMLASYRAILPYMNMNRHEAKEVLRRPLGDEGQAIPQMLVKFRLWMSRDPMESAISMARTMEMDWGKAFEVAHDTQRTPEGRAVQHETTVTKCFYNSYFRENDAEELVPLFCGFDAVFFSALSPERHGVRFERPETLAQGAPRCLFRLARAPAPPGPEAAPEGGTPAPKQ